MLIKALLIALLFYFILRVTGNLLRAVQADGRRRRPVEPPRQEKERATRYEPEMDIEDAKWEDL